MELFLRFPGGKDRALTFSYDDGTEQDERLLDLLAAHGMKGTFNLNSGMFRPEDRPRSKTAFCRRLSQSEALDLYSRETAEVALHGLTHGHLEAMGDAQAAYEILEDKARLERLFGKIIHGGAYAYGTYGQQTGDILKSCGVSYCRTTKSTHGFALPENWLRWDPTCHHTENVVPELTEKFLAAAVKAQPLLFYFWGHTFEYERDDNWDVAERFVERMAGRENIWYATNGEIWRYVTDYRRLETSADGSRVYNPTASDLWLQRGKEIHLLKSGEERFFPE